MGHHQTRIQRIAEVGALGYPSNISTTNYFALISILLALPPTLTPLRPFTNREKNAIRRANILRKKLRKNATKSLHIRPDKRP
jgi:hypothetical protein